MITQAQSNIFIFFNTYLDISSQVYKLVIKSDLSIKCTGNNMILLTKCYFIKNIHVERNGIPYNIQRRINKNLIIPIKLVIKSHYFYVVNY